MSTKAKGKKFRVATSGATIDGRTIKPEWLSQAAKNYNPADTYAARINVDHYLGWGAKSESFGAFGDVASLSTETNAKTGKLELWAELVPNARAIELNKSGQKVYTSIEIAPSFADTGEAYLVGLALTDSPASLATSRVEFSAQPEDASMSAAAFSDVGKFAKAEAFVMAHPIAFDLSDCVPDDTQKAGWFTEFKASLAAKFKAKDKDAEALAAEVRESLGTLADKTVERIEHEADAANTRADQLAGEIKGLADEIKQLKSSLDGKPAQDFKARPASSGGAGQQLTEF